MEGKKIFDDEKKIATKFLFCICKKLKTEYS